MPASSPLSSSRSPVSSAVPAPVVVSPRSASSSWTIPLAASSVTSRAQSRSTTSSACSSPNVRPAASANFLLPPNSTSLFPLEAMYVCLRWK